MALVALAGTLAIAALGYITYLGSCITNSRQQAAQLSVLGITRASFLRMAAVEHLIVAVMGLALGSVSGLLMTHVAVDAVAHTETGGRLLPPFVLTTNWAQASTLYAVVGIVAVIGAIRVFRDYSKMALHELLRLEE
jgi:ABC-type antimicrobial peptide transport system permease subunit